MRGGDKRYHTWVLSAETIIIVPHRPRHIEPNEEGQVTLCLQQISKEVWQACRQPGLGIMGDLEDMAVP